MAHVASLSCVVVGDPTTPLVVAGSALRRTGLLLTTGPRGASLRDRNGLSCALPRARNGNLRDGNLRLSAQVCLSPEGSRFLGIGFPPGSGMEVDARLDTGAESSVLSLDHARALAARLKAPGPLVRDAKGPMRAIGSGSFDVVLYQGPGPPTARCAPGVAARVGLVSTAPPVILRRH